MQLRPSLVFFLVRLLSISLLPVSVEGTDDDEKPVESEALCGVGPHLIVWEDFMSGEDVNVGNCVSGTRGGHQDAPRRGRGGCRRAAIAMFQRVGVVCQRVWGGCLGREVGDISFPEQMVESFRLNEFLFPRTNYDPTSPALTTWS